jgi:hypothetical protein
MGPDLMYVLNSGVWSLGGLLVGYAFGRLEKDVRDIKQILTSKGRNNNDDG